MLPDHIASTFRTAARGLAVQRERIAAASQNIANSRTSAAPGSSNAYKIQRVNTSAPKPQQFLDLLRENVSSLRREGNTTGMITSAGSRMQQGSTGTNMGPEYTVEQTENYRFEYDPNHPDADANGMVKYPDVDIVREMAEMVSANRLYEANLSSIQAEKEIIKRSMEI